VSAIEVSGIPAPFGVGLLTFAFILLIAPYVGGLDFGVFKVPSFPARTTRKLRIAGPVLFALVSLLHVPLLPGRATAAVDVSLLHTATKQPVDAKRAFYQLTYAYDREDETLKIRPNLPYLEVANSGGVVFGVPDSVRPFDWSFPALSVKIANLAAAPILATELEVRVVEAVPILEATLITDDRSYSGSITLRNEGWGLIDQPRLNVGFGTARNCSPAAFRVDPNWPIVLPSFADDVEVDVMSRASEWLEKEEPVCASGELTYVDDGGETRVFRFQTLLHKIGAVLGAELPPSQTYSIMLPVPARDAVVRLPLTHVIKKGDADHFTVTLGVRRSSDVRLKLALRDARRQTIGTFEVTARILAFRSREELLSDH
jgi:hypothetical protein